MKCINVFATNEVLRVTDLAAFHMVRINEASYASKKDWKDKNRNLDGKNHTQVSKKPKMKTRPYSRRMDFMMYGLRTPRPKSSKQGSQGKQ